MNTDVLAGEIRQVLDQAVTLGPHWYLDESIFRIEQQAVFGRGWQFACHVSQVAQAGDAFPVRCGEVPLVVVRDRQHELQAYVNVCRHRGHELVKEPCNRRTLQCLYHGWNFGLDGELRAAPRERREQEFDRSAFPLFRAQVDTWRGLVFVNAELDAPPLREVIGTLDDVAEERGLDLSRMVRRQRLEFPCAANWKILLDNMLECYHCPTGHPGFYEYYDVDPASYVIQLHGACSYQRGDLREKPEAQAHKSDWGDFELYFIWPNTILIPGPVSCIVMPLVPESVDHSIMAAETYFLPEVDEEKVQGYLKYYEEIWSEDVELVESVHRGQQSRRLQWGPLFTDSEHLLQQVQRLLLADISRGAPTHEMAPPMGTGAGVQR
jgi:phenylpropionate dioxygenase-like ring-hydroxylating dioxygenase large terminal subunit